MLVTCACLCVSVTTYMYDLAVPFCYLCFVIYQLSPLYLSFSATFFVTFWSMSMYDLAVPTTVYDKQIQQLTSQITAIEDNEDLVSVTSMTRGCR